MSVGRIALSERAPCFEELETSPTISQQNQEPTIITSEIADTWLLQTNRELHQ